MKLRIFTFFIAFIFSSRLFCQAPHWDWYTGVGGAGTEEGNSIALDSLGNAYVGGYFRSASLTFGAYVLTKPAGVDQAPFLVKYDYQGNVKWAKTSSVGDGWITSVVTDQYGYIYCTGIFTDSSMVIDGSALINSNQGYADVFIIKYDSAGVLQFAKNYGGPLDDKSLDIAVDNTGNIFITGSYKSPTLNAGIDSVINSSEDDYFLIKTDNLGNAIWIKGAEGTYFGDERGENLSTDSNGNVYVSGTYESDSLIISGVVFPPTAMTTGHIFLVRYDANGNLTWSAHSSNDQYDKIEDIELDVLGNVYITGYYYDDTFIFNGLTFPGNCNCGGNSTNLFLVKFDSSLNTIWSTYKTTFGVQTYFSPRDMTIDQDQNIFLGGYYGSYYANTFGATSLPGTGGFSGHGDLLIFKYSSSGSEVWAKYYPTPGVDDVGKGIAVYTDGSIFLTGCIGTSGNLNVITCKTLPSYVPVWPGDTDNNSVVNNYDLLPIGLTFNESGMPRSATGNVWQADTASDWGTTIPGIKYDKKHADSNGDGVVDYNDTLAISLNFSQTHSFVPFEGIERSGVELYFVMDSSDYNPGEQMNIQVWAGSSSFPFWWLYGLAFDINYDANLVQPGTEKLTYYGSVLGDPGVDVITFSKFDPLASAIHGSIVRTDHNNVMNSYGKIADIKFQVKNLVSTPSFFNLSFANFKSINKDGSVYSLTAVADSVLINAGSSSVGISEHSDEKPIIAPNPFDSQTTIFFNKEYHNAVLRITDILGKELKAIKFNGKKLILEKDGLVPGVYSVQITTEEGYFITEKIIIQ